MRFKRCGRKRQPTYRIVVMERATRRDGRPVEELGYYNPLTKENLIKMSNKVTEVTKDILPDQDIDCVVYGCTSGTIAAGYESIEKK